MAGSRSRLRSDRAYHERRAPGYMDGEHVMGSSLESWPALGTHFSEEGTWKPRPRVDDHQLWHAHSRLKSALMRLVREKARHGFRDRSHEAAQLVGSGLLLDPDGVTIGFARRFATYKRADLIFRDVERLRALLVNTPGRCRSSSAARRIPKTPRQEGVTKRSPFQARDPQFEGRVGSSRTTTLTCAHLLVQAWTCG